MEISIGSLLIILTAAWCLENEQKRNKLQTQVLETLETIIQQQDLIDQQTRDHKSLQKGVDTMNKNLFKKVKDEMTKLIEIQVKERTRPIWEQVDPLFDRAKLEEINTKHIAILEDKIQKQMDQQSLTLTSHQNLIGDICDLQQDNINCNNQLKEGLDRLLVQLQTHINHRAHQEEVTQTEINIISEQIELLNKNHDEMQLDLTRVENELHTEEIKQNFKTIKDIERLDLLLVKEHGNILSLGNKIDAFSKTQTRKDDEDEYRDTRLNKIDTLLHNHEQAIVKTYSKLMDQTESVKTCQQINTDLDEQMKQVYKLILKISEDQSKIEQEETQRQRIIGELLENILGGTIFNENLMKEQETEDKPDEQDPKEQMEKPSQSPIHITIELTEDIQPKSRPEISFIRDYAYAPFKAKKIEPEDFTPNHYNSRREEDTKSEKEIPGEDSSSSDEA